MRRVRAVILVCSCLAGCVSFVPRQDADIITLVDQVQDQLSKARTTVLVDPGAGYAKVEPFYIGALSNADRAKAAAYRRRRGGVSGER